VWAPGSQAEAAGFLVGANSFPGTKRLLTAHDFKQVFDGVDIRAAHKNLLLLARYNALPCHRLGLVIAKKHVKLAAQRNRIKRVSRDFFRHCPDEERNLDVIILARQGVDQLDNCELSSILRQQWHKLTAA
jgi:ribonuclease P protein component